MTQTSNHKTAKEIINSLNTGNYYCECPCGCGEEIKLKDADLFYLDNFTANGKQAQEAMLEELKKQRLKFSRKKEHKSKHTQSVNFGFISEKIVTALKNFPFEHNDCRSLFKPIDYIIFESLNKKGFVTKIIFTEIKSGGAYLNQHQKEIKSLVENRKVEFKVY